MSETPSVLRHLLPNRRATAALWAIDARSVARDGLLAVTLAMPLLVALAVRYGTPPLAAALKTHLAFDLVPYYPLIMSNLVVIAVNTVGGMIGFMMLDERDDGTVKALRVTPVPVRAYLAYRLGVPTVLAFVMTLACYPLAGLTPLPLAALVPIAACGALLAPAMALFLAATAANKVAGLALFKLVGGVLNIPLIAYFVPPVWQPLFGVVPTFWPMKAVWAGAESGAAWPYLVAGTALSFVAIVLLARRLAARAVD